MTIVSDHPWLKACKVWNIYMNVVRMEHHANLLWIPADSKYNINEVNNMISYIDNNLIWCLGLVGEVFQEE